MDLGLINIRSSDPLLNFRFIVEIDGLLVAGFNEVSGLSIELETEEFKEGGVNDYVHILPKTVKYSKIVLKQGITYSSSLYDWMEDAVYGVIKKKDGRIMLMDTMGIPMWYWSIDQAYPVKWSATDLKANGAEVFIETLEIAHNGIRKYRMMSQALHTVYNR